MAETEKSEQPQSNGLENGLDEDERTKLRPADIDADVREMERRKRVEMIMGSKLFREELERIIELQMKDGNGPAGLLQQISDMMGIQSGKLHTTHMWRGTNCVTPINDIRGVESMGYEKGEKNLRCKLASVFRLMDLYGWSQGISNQITARLNQDEEHFLVNPHGMLFNEITASSLIKCDMQGNIVESGTTNFTVLTQGFLLHSAIHASRPDINCIIHIRTPSVLAVSSLKCGLLPLCQESLVIGEVSQHPFLCGIFEPEEREKIIRNLGPSNKVLLLYNNGAICCGGTVEEAFYNAYNTVLACETQVKLMPIGIENLVLVNDETRKQVYDAAHRAPEVSAAADKKAKQFRVGEMEFEALIRMLDNAGFRTGYIYRHPLVKGELPKPKNDVEVPPAVSSLGYLIEQEELYKQGNWKKYVDGRNRLDRTKWLNSPNVYQKVEILETGTSDPKKITKWVDQNSEEWVAESSPTHSSTPVKIESALQFVPKGTNPKEFKKLQQQIKENRRADKITSGPQSHILEGVSWEEAKKLQDANITHTGDQVILVGAASKGIIQRNYQHNALVYKTPYAKNPFDSMSDKEIEDYKQLVERKQRGDTDYEESQSESEAISSSRQDALRHFKSPLMSPQSATSETEEESRDEPRVLRIETKTAPRPIQAEVVLSDAESDSTDARVERSHSARYPKAEKPESVTLMNSFRKSWSLKREKDKSKDVDNPEACDTRNLHPSFILSECERDRMESLHCCVARITQLTHKPLIVDLGSKALRPLLKSASDPCSLSAFLGGDVENPQPGIAKDLNTSLSCSSISHMSDLKRRLNIRKKLLYSAKMKFLGLHNTDAQAGVERQENTSTSPMCALISEIRETLNEIMSPERSKNSEESTEDYFSSMRWRERPKFVPGRSSEVDGTDREQSKSRTSLNKPFQDGAGDGSHLEILARAAELESLSDFRKDFQVLPSEESDAVESHSASESLNCTCVIHGEEPEKVSGDEDSKARPKVDENQNEEREVENFVGKVVTRYNVSDEEATYTVTDDSLLQTYSFTETTETEWYYDKTIMAQENSQTVLEVKDAESKENLEEPVVKYVDTGIDTDFTSEKENDEKPAEKEEAENEGEQLETIEDVDVDVPVCESLTLNKSSETDSSFLKSGSGKTSSDVDTSFAFKTETENSEKILSPEKKSALDRSFEEKKKFLEGMLDNTKEVGEESFDSEPASETKSPECQENSKTKFESSSKLPGIPESPEFTNVDTEDAPITSSSKDTSPEIAGDGERLKEDDPLETTNEPDIESEKEKERARPEHKKKKSVKSSTKITVKKELKEQNCDEPIVSEIKLTIKNSKPCQSEKYEVKIQDVTNTSEELSRSVSSVGENFDSYESFEIVDNDCGCEARQNLEELQGEVSSTIKKLQSIENYFEDEIKRNSNESFWESEKVCKSPEKFTIEYNYREFEGVLNESEDKLETLRSRDFPEGPEFLGELPEEGIGNEFSSRRVSEIEMGGCGEGAGENVVYYVSDILGNICGEIEVGGEFEEEVEIVGGSAEKSEIVEEGRMEPSGDNVVQGGVEFPTLEDELEIKEAELEEVKVSKKNSEEDFETGSKEEREGKFSKETIGQRDGFMEANSGNENLEEVFEKEYLTGIDLENGGKIPRSRDEEEQFEKRSERKAVEEVISEETNTEQEDEAKVEIVYERLGESETAGIEVVERVQDKRIVGEENPPETVAEVEVCGGNASLVAEIITENEERVTIQDITQVDANAKDKTLADGDAGEPNIPEETHQNFFFGESTNEEEKESDHRQEMKNAVEQIVLSIIEGLESTEPEEPKTRFEMTSATAELVIRDDGDYFQNVKGTADTNLITAAEPKDETKVLPLFRFFHNRFYSSFKAITWKESSENKRGKSLSVEAIDYILNCLLNSATREDKGKLKTSTNDVLNFILTNEESPTDSLTEFEDMENIVSASSSVVAELVDSVESQLEGGVESLPNEADTKDKDELRIQNRGKSNPIFKVTVMTPTKKEIFINYSVDSSSSFNISSDSEASAQLCNSYIYADEVNEDFENLSSDNPDFFSVGSPGKFSLDSSFGSVASGADTFFFSDCENSAMKNSPRSLAIIQEVDEGGDSRAPSELPAPSRPDN